MTRLKRQPESAANGLPRSEQLLLASGIRLSARFYSKDRITDLFRDEARQVLELATRVAPEDGRRRVRIQRFFGVEHASCDWSLFMTLDHLVIMNTAITALLPRLSACHERSVSFPLDDLNPSPDAGAELIVSLETLIERYTEVVNKLGNLHAGSRCYHPGLGALSAAQWHALSAFHTSTHRRQMERIVRLL